jgi:hypothetical protein
VKKLTGKSRIGNFIMKMIILSVFALGLCSQSFATQCDYGGLQVELRNGADDLAKAVHVSYKNTIKYTDFDNEQSFQIALDKMEAIKVSPAEVEAAWLKGIKSICESNPAAQKLTLSDVGPTQSLETLAAQLGITF